MIRTYIGFYVYVVCDVFESSKDEIEITFNIVTHRGSMGTIWRIHLFDKLGPIPNRIYIKIRI